MTLVNIKVSHDKNPHSKPSFSPNHPLKLIQFTSIQNPKEFQKSDEP